MEPARPSFRPDIEGLRGIAILLVVAFHAAVSVLAGGYVGVDVFFVLSGFLISGSLSREAIGRGDIDLAAFYARRARRLLPAFLLVLAATVALAFWIYAPIDRPQIAFDARAVALHGGNVLFAQSATNYHATSHNPLLHTWSLAVEEQFYLIWPLLFLFAARSTEGGGITRRRLLQAIAAAGVASFLVSWWTTSTAQLWAFFGMPTRIWEFAVGGALALTLDEQTRIPARVGGLLQVGGLAAIGVAALTVHDATPYPGLAALLPVIGTAALLVGGSRAPASAVSNVLSARVPQWLGSVSYAWYLWHWPLVGVGAVIDWRLGVGGRIVWSLGALGLAVLTHRYIEEPVRRGEWPSWSAERVGLAAVAASVGAAALLHVAMLGAFTRVRSTDQRAFFAARADHMHHDCWGSLVENATAPCVFGDRRASTSVVLFGDSHAEHWLPALDRIGRERHWKVYAMVKPACPVSDAPELVNARLKRSYDECTAWRRAMVRRIIALHPDVAILSSYDHYLAPEGVSSWQLTPEQWGAGLRRTYAALDAAGISTVAMRDVPQPGFDVPACLSRRAAATPFRIRDCSYSLRESVSPRAVRAQNDAARGLGHLSFVDMTDQLCAGDACSVAPRGVIAYRDDDHLTATFSRAVAPALAARLAPIVERTRR